MSNLSPEVGLAAGWLRRAAFLFPILAIILCLLNWWQGQRVTANAQVAAAQAARMWVSQGPRFPLEALNQAWIVPPSISPLASFDPGDGPWLGTALFLQLGRLARSQDQLAYDYFPAGRQIEFHPALLLQFMIPALALLIALRDAKQASLTRHCVEIIERVLPSLALVLLLTSVLNYAQLGLSGASRLLLLLATYLLYAIASMAMTRLFFCRISSSQLALCLASIFWLVNLSLARPLTVNLAALYEPLPRLEEFIQLLDQETRFGYLGADPKADRDRRHIAEALRDYKVKTIAELPINLSALLLQKEERHQREVFQRRFLEVQSKFETQEKIQCFAAYLFPSIAIQLASTSLSATDFPSERWQMAELDAYWDRLVSKVYSDVVTKSGPEGAMNPVPASYWQQFAPFLPSLPPPPFALMQASLPLGAIVLLGGLAAFFARLRKSEHPGE